MNFLLKLLIIALVLIIPLTILSYVLSDIDKENKYIEELKREAKTYDPKDVRYEDPNIKNSLDTIRFTNDCDNLKKLFQDNYEWSARPLLADKILGQCL